MNGRSPVTLGPVALIRYALYVPGFLRVFGRLMHDPRVSWWAKLIPAAMLVWFVSPWDIDWIPFVGWVDDLAVLAFGTRLFVRCCPAEAVAEHVGAVGGRLAGKI